MDLTLAIYLAEILYEVRDICMINLETQCRDSGRGGFGEASTSGRIAAYKEWTPPKGSRKEDIALPAESGWQWTDEWHASVSILLCQSLCHPNYAGHSKSHEYIRGGNCQLQLCCHVTCLSGDMCARLRDGMMLLLMFASFASLNIHSFYTVIDPPSFCR